MSAEEMTPKEVEQFLSCARVGHLGLSLKDGSPYVVPVGYAYTDGKIFFHTCNKGLKMNALRQNANVCFEVDETLSDASMFKSVIVFGKAEIISDKAKMIPYLQKLIDKYRSRKLRRLYEQARKKQRKRITSSENLPNNAKQNHKQKMEMKG